MKYDKVNDKMKEEKRKKEKEKHVLSDKTSNIILTKLNSKTQLCFPRFSKVGTNWRMSY